MLRKILLRLAASLALMGLFPGCLPNKSFRPGNAATEPRLRGARDYDLGFIEFDEQGDFWDRAQLAAAVGLIKQTRKPLLVVYAHGWQNNASDEVYDVPQFRNVLEKLARTDRVRELNYQVVGVYLGWRGKQAYDPLLKVLSFENRKDAATRIGSSNTITEAIFRVVYEARHRSSAARTILIGHSFGALVVERAVEQAMTGGILTGKPVVPADFILLINSAAESIYAKEMRDMMTATLSFDTARKCYQAPDDSGCYLKDEPRIISVTSETDSATGLAFPIGANIFGIGKLYRDYDGPETSGQRVSQRLFFNHTPGHNERLLDHAIVPLTGELPMPRRPRAFEENLEFPQALPASGADNQATPIFATGGEETAAGKTTVWRWWRLQYTGDAKQRSPFWIVKVPKEILNGHGGIFNPNARDMMAALFRLSNVLDRENAELPRIEIKSRPSSAGQPLAEAKPLAAPAVPQSESETTSAAETTAAQLSPSPSKIHRARTHKAEFLQFKRRVTGPPSSANQAGP
jgi:hypothetical protein